MPGDRASDRQLNEALTMTFRNDGTMEMTARVMQTRHSGFTWHCQGRYEFAGDKLERNFSSCRSCPVGGSCVDLPLTQIPNGVEANFRVSFLTPNSVQIGTAILFADKRK
jgi:hypothetical protein